MYQIPNNSEVHFLSILSMHFSPFQPSQKRPLNHINHHYKHICKWPQLNRQADPLAETSVLITAIWGGVGKGYVSEDEAS